MAPRSDATVRSRPSESSDGSARRSVRITHESGLFRIVSEDGEVGGIFVTRAAAVRFAEHEFRLAQGRVIVDDELDAE